jgi:hypothetical protein
MALSDSPETNDESILIVLGSIIDALSLGFRDSFASLITGTLLI